MSTEAIIDQLKTQGYVVLREKSYRQAQERQRCAEAVSHYAKEAEQRTFEWAQTVCAEERRLRERLTAVFAAVASLGVTTEQLAAVANNIQGT